MDSTRPAQSRPSSTALSRVLRCLVSRAEHPADGLLAASAHSLPQPKGPWNLARKLCSAVKAANTPAGRSNDRIEAQSERLRDRQLSTDAPRLGAPVLW